jgi:hypothetical protein
MTRKILRIMGAVIVTLSFVLIRPNSSIAIQWPGFGLRSFEQINVDGFGSRHNSYAWSMAWFKDKLYVGTNRDFFCYMAMLFGDTYPPQTLNMDCQENPDFRAEIWSFDPKTNNWELAYRSPHIQTLTKLVARDLGYRGMAVVTEPDGNEALYIGGYLSKVLANYPARLLRTTDGKSFQEVRSTDPQVLGTNNIFSIRSLVQYGDKLYVTTEATPPAKPMLLESDMIVQNIQPLPNEGAEVTMNFRQVNPDGIYPLEMVVFNDFLYVGTMDPTAGFSLLKTNAQGEPPYDFAPVLTDGAFRVNRDREEAHNLNEYAISMCVFRNHLYIGTGCGIGGYDFVNKVGPAAAEVIRIDDSDRWQLVCGKSRQTPDGIKAPISGMPAGFGNPFVGYFWRMTVHNGWLYVSGTDSSVSLLSAELWKDKIPEEYRDAVERYGERMANLMGGFDLWKTRNGFQWFPVSLTGFDDPFNIGARTFQSTPAGLFVGTANPFFGCQVWLGDNRSPLARDLLVEPDGEGIRLEWGTPGVPVTSHIYRKELFQGVGIGPDSLTEIGETTGRYYFDQDVTPGSIYMYLVKCETGQGYLSEYSNAAICQLSQSRIRLFLPSDRRESISNQYTQLMNLLNMYQEKASSLPYFIAPWGLPFNTAPVWEFSFTGPGEFLSSTSFFRQRAGTVR